MLARTVLPLLVEEVAGWAPHASDSRLVAAVVTAARWALALVAALVWAQPRTRWSCGDQVPQS